MNANAAPLLAIFEKKLRLEVPLFQRQYVWTLDQQWEPLWEDIARKFGEYLEGRRDGPVHFLGAMVLDQRQTPTTHVEKRQVIDGQQRLITLQIFLAAFRDFCHANDSIDLAEECELFLLNKGMMADPEVDKYKVWPTQMDRRQFGDVVGSGSRLQVEKKNPLVWIKYARKAQPRPRMVEAYLYFYDQLKDYFVGSEAEPPLASHRPLAERLEECFQALRGALQIVAIDLDHDDDAQVIFETLNARGEPLLPADLLRNFIFLRGAREGENQEQLYEQYWKRFDDPFWRVEVKQGRLSRPRSDLYLQHFLASRQTVDIPIKHLFVEYKHWIKKAKPFATIREELATLARQGDHFRRIIDAPKSDVLFPLVVFLDAFDIRTAYPLLLFLLDAELSDEEWAVVTTVLQSYLLRRAVCGYTTKNYNRVFLQLTRMLRESGPSSRMIVEHLSGLTGDSAVWPDDHVFKEAWMLKHAYQALQNQKLVYILRRLDAEYRTAKNEDIQVTGPLSVEHIMPQNWLEHWPLRDGGRGMPTPELWTAASDDERAKATKFRHALVQTMGNLTILTQPLNSSVSNSAWSDKRPALMKASLLPINQSLGTREIWDERFIAQRGEELFAHAVKLWPGPRRVSA